MSTNVNDTVVEGERIERTAPTALADQQQREAGINALARLSDDEFDARMKSLVLGLARFDKMMKEVLGPEDLMKLEGVEKPILTLSGAEKIAFVTRLVPTFDVKATYGNGENEPAISYTVLSALHLGNADGPVVATGVGTCNSHEKKYRYRYAEKNCPECGVVGSLRRSRFPAKAGSQFAGTKPFFCWNKLGGCGREFGEADERVTKQPIGLVDNPDPFDLDNTLAKMAKKRAFVDGIKTATAASGRVTQDLDETRETTTESKDPAVLRDSIMESARLLGWKTLGELLDVARKATGLPVRTKEDFDRLAPSDLAKVLAAMPKPTRPSSDDEPLPTTTREDLRVGTQDPTTNEREPGDDD